jgi:hypothetical protein
VPEGGDAIHIFGKISGMLDLSRDEKVACPAKAWNGRGQGLF